MVENSDTSPNRLTAFLIRRILASRGVLPSPIFSSEDRYACSYVRVPARGLPSSLPAAALVS